MRNYTQLTQLHQKYKDRGLAILAFPCNQFGSQEPGTLPEIREFANTLGTCLVSPCRVSRRGEAERGEGRGLCTIFHSISRWAGNDPGTRQPLIPPVSPLFAFT